MPTASKDTQYTGKQVFSKGETTNIREYAGTQYKIVGTAKRVNNGKVTAFGQLTGFFYNEKPYTWFQVISGNIKGWVRNDVITFSKGTSTQDNDSQSMMNQLTSNNLRIREQLTAMIPLLQSLKKQGKLTQAHVNQFKNLGNKLIIRENEIKNSKLLKTETGIRESYNNFMLKYGFSSLTISGSKSIGVAPVVLWIVGVIVVMGTGAAVYAYFKGYFGESKSDLIVSDELARVLATLDPNLSNQIRADLEGQINDAYQSGREDEKGSGGMFGDFKNIGLFAGGLFLAKLLLNNSR